jgi:flagellar hook protein FlgE
LTDGANDLNVNWASGIFTGVKTITHVASASTNNAIIQTGSDIPVASIRDLPWILAEWLQRNTSNGQNIVIGQIAVATVTNTAGLTASGNNDFKTTAVSGQASVGLAGVGGAIPLLTAHLSNRM